MTELETMQRAKMYLDKLANGIDPLTDRPVPDGDSINQVRISRCLFYVSGVLEKVIENGGQIGRPERIKKEPFMISPEELKRFNVSERPVTVSAFTAMVNELIDQSVMKRLTHRSVTAFLIRCGMLEEIKTADGRTRKEPTEQGRSIGISTEEHTGMTGTYRVTVYNAEAQQFILDNIYAVIDEARRKQGVE
ncbi:MAG: hypothetical protein IKD89_04375 [Clostridia bacterium]|nr:hypothetical protein [Clostridia bacterium]